MDASPALRDAAGRVRARLLLEGEPPALGVVLGSGWDAAASGLPTVGGMDYGEIPGFGSTGAPGHRGRLEAAAVGEARVLVFRGRFHVYEGRSAREAARPVELLAALGCSRVLLGCASGSVDSDLDPGDLLLVTDHINLMGADPAADETRIGETGFPDRTVVYDPALGRLARRVAAECGVVLREGVLAALRGPGFETPAEIRAMGRIGADVVSMSTVPEALRARDLGMEVVALAVVANRGAGLSKEPVRHDAVLSTVTEALESRAGFLTRLIREMAAGGGAERVRASS